MEPTAYWVKWVDAATNAGHQWRTKAELDSLTHPVCELVGFVYKVTPDFIVFINCRNFDKAEESEFWGEMLLPLGSIVEMRELKLGKLVPPKKLKPLKETK